MGCCFSFPKATAPLPAMKKSENGAGHAAVASDEIFFDSRVWLDSDCESDFFSIRGDFTPSCGGSPEVSLKGKPKVEKPLDLDGFSETQSEPSPRKELAEFLLEKISTERDNAVNGK